MLELFAPVWGGCFSVPGLGERPCMGAMHERGVGSCTAAAPVSESTTSSQRRAVKGACARMEAGSAVGVAGALGWNGEVLVVPGRELTRTFANAASAGTMNCQDHVLKFCIGTAFFIRPEQL